MTDQCTKDHVVSDRPMKRVLDDQLNTFMSVVTELGFSPSTIQTQLELLKAS